MQIRQLLQRDLSTKIEEIIQVDQTDEHSVHTEITEYVVTDRIRDHYRHMLEAVAKAPNEPDEGVGVWVSGFFGSGKSSFAKNLGYILANKTVLGETAGRLFKQQVRDERIHALIDSINSRIPTEVMMFDVQKDRSQSGQGNLSISPFIYRVLLRELDYAQDFDVAELEITLEGSGKLDEFVSRFNNEYAPGDDQRNQWTQRGRSGTEVWNRAGFILHQMDSRTYPAPESFAQGLAQHRVEVSPRLLVERSFELMSRRRPGKALAFIIDEIGQYVAYSQERLEDLRAVVELFGRESKNRIKARTLVAPVWVIVTSQERLDEVTSAMGDVKRVLFAKVRDRFPHTIDLSPADIREVATKRVLSKTPQGQQTLLQLFDDHQGQLNTACKLERTARASELPRDQFAQFYPYLPHYVELSIDIVSGIRLQPGATRHIGGSNRTIIGQVYQMLVNPRTNFANKSLGALVTLDKLYELLEGQIGSVKQKDISDIANRFGSDPQLQEWAVRVAKVIALLEFVRDLPRTSHNIAALMVDEVGKPAPHQAVEKALETLVLYEFVRLTEEGYKLQTAEEKSWTSERNALLEIKPKDRHEIERGVLEEVFNDPKLKTYNYRGLRTFQVGITVNDVRIGNEAQIPLALVVAEDSGDFNRRLEETRVNSRSTNHYNEICWVFALNSAIDDLVANLHASRQMVNRYNVLSSQGKINNEQAACLTSERNEVGRIQSRLREKMLEALGQGQSLFRGATRDASDLGKTTPEIFKKLFDLYVPDLYPKLEIGARPLKGTEPEEVLKAATLNALPQVFYSGDGGLGLVIDEGSKQVLNPSAEIAKEVLDYLKREHQYGNKVTGKSLEEHFHGLGYGWERDMLRLVLAVLLRAGAVEVTHQGRRFRNHLDPQCRTPLINNTAFKAAGFAPRESIDLKTLIAAVKNYEQLTGDEVDVEEGAIAGVFKKLAADEMALLLPVISEVRANRLPVQDLLEDYRNTLLSIQNAASDDCVRILAGEGNSLRDVRDRVRQIRDAVSDQNMDQIRLARRTVDEISPALNALGADETIASITEELQSLIISKDFFETIPRIKALSNQLRDTYRTYYLERHEARYSAFAKVIEEIKGRVEWPLLTDELRDTLLRPLTSRMCCTTQPEAAQPPELLPEPATRCIRCQATIDQMASDIAALPSLKGQIIVRIQTETATQERVERIRITDFFTGALDSTEAVDAAIELLRAELHKLIAEGAAIVLE